MTDYELKVPSNLLSSLQGEKGALSGLLEAVLNQVLEAQAVEQVGAGWYERSEERTTYRNGYPRPATVYAGWPADPAGTAAA